jgi:hypothetical protein
MSTSRCKGALSNLNLAHASEARFLYFSNELAPVPRPAALPPFDPLHVLQRPPSCTALAASAQERYPRGIERDTRGSARNLPL